MMKAYSRIDFIKFECIDQLVLSATDLEREQTEIPSRFRTSCCF